MEFEGAVVSVIYSCTPKEMVIPKYLRNKFKFLHSNNLFLQIVKEARENRDKRIVGFIKNIGPLRVGVKEQWHQIILSFESINKGCNLINSPLIPLYAVSKKQFFIKTTDEKGNTRKFPGKIIVSIYPLFTFSIRLVFKIKSTVSPKWLIDLLKQQQVKLTITYKGETFSRLIDFASRIKLWTLLSLFNTEYVRQVQVDLSKQSNAVYLKGSTLIRDLKPVIGVALGIKNYEQLNSSVISKYTKYMPRLYRGDVMISSEQGLVVYSPFLTLNGSKMQRKRFRRNIFLATESAYVVKSYLKNSVEILKMAIRENVGMIRDLILRSFVTANPFALGKYKFSMGLLKPHTMQKLFKSIMFKLELLNVYSNAIHSEGTILSNILTPELVDIYAEIKSLSLPLVTEVVDKLYKESFALKIPNLITQLRELFPEKYRDFMSLTVNYLIDEFKKDYFNWFNEKVQETSLGWRLVKEIYEGIKLKEPKVQRDLFYAHKKKGLPGLIFLLEKYGVIEVRKVPSAGRKGKAMKIRINPRFPVVEYILKMIGVDL